MENLSEAGIQRDSVDVVLYVLKQRVLLLWFSACEGILKDNQCGSNTTAWSENKKSLPHPPCKEIIMPVADLTYILQGKKNKCHDLFYL